jgi:hypothetical protein
MRVMVARRSAHARAVRAIRLDVDGAGGTKGSSRERERVSARQDFAFNLSAKRRLCNTVGGRVIEGAPRRCAVLIA